MRCLVCNVTHAIRIFLLLKQESVKIVVVDSLMYPICILIDKTEFLHTSRIPVIGVSISLMACLEKILFFEATADVTRCLFHCGLFYVHAASSLMT